MVYWVKMCPIFDSSQSSRVTRYRKMFLGCSFGCNSLLDFTCLTMNFHNCHQTYSKVQKICSETRFSKRRFLCGLCFRLLSTQPNPITLFKLCEYNPPPTKAHPPLFNVPQSRQGKPSCQVSMLTEIEEKQVRKLHLQ